MNPFHFQVNWTGPTATPRTLTAAEKREQNRLKRIEEWARKVRLRADAYLEMRLMEIEADEQANAWRPRVSSKDNHDFILTYHSLRRYGPDDGDKWRTFRNRYNKGWCGITVSGISNFEFTQIKKLLRKFRRPNYLMTEETYETTSKSTGTFEDICLCIWLRNLADHNALMELLDTIRDRTGFMKLGDSANIEEIEKLLIGVNHRIFSGDQMILTYDATISKSLEVMIKMLS